MGQRDSGFPVARARSVGRDSAAGADEPLHRQSTVRPVRDGEVHDAVRTYDRVWAGRSGPAANPGLLTQLDWMNSNCSSREVTKQWNARPRSCSGSVSNGTPNAIPRRMSRGADGANARGVGLADVRGARRDGPGGVLAEVERVVVRAVPGGRVGWVGQGEPVELTAHEQRAEAVRCRRRDGLCGEGCELGPPCVDILFQAAHDVD